MKQLSLLRHGHAEWNDASMADFDRPLTRRGLSEAADAGKRLASREPLPELLFTSSANRAASTAAAVGRECGLGDRFIKSMESLYLAHPEELLAAVATCGPKIGHLVVVGHNPGLSDFARRLAPNVEFEEFATAAICTLEFDVEDWASVGFGTALRASYDAPRRFFDLWH